MGNPFESTILVLDDDKSILDTMELVFEGRVRRIITTSDQNNVLSLLGVEKPDLVIMDMNYSRGSVDGSEGIHLLRQIREEGFDIPVIVITAYGEIDLVVECMKLGAVDFIQKPWSNQRLLVTASNALKLNQSETRVQALEAENSYYKDVSTKNPTGNLGMIGSSELMNKLRKDIAKVAQSDANVLILGENGTGKELVAQAIHNQSPRSNESFIKIDLGSVHAQLFESEMFGAKKGAYTGSLNEKTGRMVLANKGTLFLDEIGNLQLSMQAKILSVLQNRELMLVGGLQPIKIDIRVVSATNMEIDDLLNEELFRQDLLYRINTVEIKIPPLRERADDIPELIYYFKELYEKKYNKRIVGVSAKVIEKAQSYDWPGNVRELQHAVERAVLMSSDNRLGVQDLIPSRVKSKKNNDSASLNLESMEKRLIEKALKKNTGNMTRAAADLGLTRAALYRRIEKYGL